MYGEGGSVPEGGIPPFHQSVMKNNMFIAQSKIQEHST